MLQELTATTGAAAWAIASMLFFLAAWLGVMVWVLRARPEAMDRMARMALDGGNDAFEREPAAGSRL